MSILTYIDIVAIIILLVIRVYFGEAINEPDFGYKDNIELIFKIIYILCFCYIIIVFMFYAIIGIIKFTKT